MRRWITAAVAAAALAVPATAQAANKFPDFSNNDPCYCANTLAHRGYKGEIDKANQGTRFIDLTFAAMVQDAKNHNLAVTGYDFDETYTAAEAYTFVARLKAAGIEKNSLRTFPPALDVEYGNSNRAGLEHQLAVLFRTYGRAQIYTDAWYWLPHFGCWIPPKVTFWLSGYPIASLLCSLKASNFVSHQYTDHEFNGTNYSDVSVFLRNQAYWNSYTQQAPVQITSAQRQKELNAKYRLRNLERAFLTKHHCRKPPYRTATPTRYKHACVVELQHGRATNKSIKAYHVKYHV